MTKAIVESDNIDLVDVQKPENKYADNKLQRKKTSALEARHRIEDIAEIKKLAQLLDYL